MYPRTLRNAQIAFMLLATMLVTACGLNLGAVKPESFNQYALLATHSATTALDLIDGLRAAGKLTGDEVREKVAEVDKFKAGIDAARVLYETQPEQAQNDLDRIIAGLNALQTLLEAKKGGP